MTRPGELYYRKGHGDHVLITKVVEYNRHADIWTIHLYNLEKGMHDIYTNPFGPDLPSTSFERL